MARIALIGACGNVGSRILRELVARGHSVTAIDRNPDKTERPAGVNAIRGDVQDCGSSPSLTITSAQ